MRITPLLVAAFLLLFAASLPWSEGVAAGRLPDTALVTWDTLGGRGTLQTENNTTPPSFAELVPIIIFVLAGVGIAIVIVAAGLWIARRGRKGKGGEGQASPPEGKDGENGEDDEWGAKWES
jgi:hypothetical protein